MFLLGFVDSQDIYTMIETSNQQFEVFRFLWEQIGQSTVLSGLLMLGRYFVVGSLVFYAYQLYRRVLDELDWRPILQSMIGPLIFLLLLGNPANPSNSGVWVLGREAPNIIRRINVTISENFVKDANLQRESQVFRAERYIEERAKAALNECNQLIDEQQQNQCIAQRVVPLRERLEAALASTRGRLREGQINSGQFFEQFLQAIDEVEQGGTTNLFQRIGNNISRGITDFILDALATIITMVGWGVGYCVEIAFIIAALLGPLAIGLSLLPFPTKPVYSWAIGYIGLGVFRIAYTIIVGLGSYVLNRMPNFAQTDYILFALIVGFFGPVLAGSAGSWSASSILESSQSATQRVVSTTIGAGIGLTSLVSRTALRNTVEQIQRGINSRTLDNSSIN